MYCKVCGNLLEESDLICKVCGADIQKQQRQTDEEAAFADVAPTEQIDTDTAFPQGDADEADAFVERETVSSHGTDGDDASAIDPPGTDATESAEPETVAPKTVASESDAEDASPEPAARDETAGGEFRWNIHRFPSAEIRKTEDIDFDWNLSPAALESRKRSEEEAEADEDTPTADAIAGVESLDEFFALRASRENAETAENTVGAPAEAFGAEDVTARADLTPVFVGLDARREADADIQQFFAKEDDGQRGAGTESAPPAPAWLHAESTPNIFGPSAESDAGTSNRDRFFTFDKKNEEFQKLLDKEYERLQRYNSPIVNEAREMIAAWDSSAGAAGKRTDPATKRWTPSMFTDPLRQEAGRGDAEADAPAKPMLSESAPSVEEDLAAGAADERAAAETPAEEAPPKLGLPADKEPATESKPEEGAAAEDSAVAGEDAADARETRGESAAPESHAAAGTEAELSISKTLDAIEKDIKEWEDRERLSTASKAAIVVSIVFLLFTGGSAAVKQFMPHSPADVWFDSVQLRMAAAIKHGVDAIRDLFDGADDAGGADNVDAGDGAGDGVPENGGEDEP
jgi:hypothetical protein